MSSVYGNAFITIVAAGAPGSQHGLRHAWPFLCRLRDSNTSALCARGPSREIGSYNTPAKPSGAMMGYLSGSWSKWPFNFVRRESERPDDTHILPSELPDEDVKYQENVSWRQTSADCISPRRKGQINPAIYNLSDEFCSEQWLSEDVNIPNGDKDKRPGVTEQPWARDSEGGLGVNMGSEAISTRAWTLQEWLLSRRLLVFATTGVYFICDERPLPTTNLLYSLRLAPPGPRAWMSKKIGFINLWQRIVINFCARDLTDPADKLPAISGLVEAYSSMMGWPRTDYVAGVWRETLVKDLLWVRASMQGLPSTQQSGRRPTRAPSWSWASIDGNVTYLELPKQWCRLRGTMALYKATVNADVKICNNEGLASGKETSEQQMTAGGWLLIRCRYLETVVDMTDVELDKTTHAPFQDWNAVTYNLGPVSLPKKDRARIVWDDPSEFSQLHLGEAQPELNKPKLHFLDFAQLVMDGNTQWVGLVVRFNEVAHTYRRLGLFQCRWSGLFKEAHEMEFRV